MPRLRDEAPAARAIGMDLSVFRHLVDTGVLPKPLPHCNKYDMKAVHAALDRMSGIGSPSNQYERWKENRRAR